MPELKQVNTRKVGSALHQTILELPRAVRSPRIPQKEGVAQMAGRILVAWKSGHGASLQYELEHARFVTSQADQSSTFEMERLEALTGAVESLENDRARHSGAVRLLEHLAQAGGR